MAESQSARGIVDKAAEVAPHPLTDRLDRLEAGCLPVGVDADAFGAAMVDGNEHRGLAFAGDRRCQVGAPHRVERIGSDGTVMVGRPARRAGADSDSFRPGIPI